MMQKAEDKVNHCILLCNKNETCENLCRKPIEELNQFAKNKTNIYVTKGVEYCKSECWEAKDISQCSDRCVNDYSVLAEEFKDVLKAHYDSTKFYNN